MKLLKMASALIFLATGSFAESNKQTALSRSNRLISESGQKHVQKAMEATKLLLVTATSNIKPLRHNITVIENRMASLASLKKSCVKLQANYNDYLVALQRALRNNDETIEKLTKLEAKTRGIASVENPSWKLTKEIVDLERKDRIQWKLDSTQKIIRVKALLKDLADSMAQIENTHVATAEQLKHWKDKLKEHETLITRFLATKAQLERLMTE